MVSLRHPHPNPAASLVVSHTLAARSLTHARETSLNLHCSMRSFASLSASSSNPIVLVKGRVVGEPNASPPVQFAGNARTSVVAILTVLGYDNVPAEGCQTHVEQLFARGWWMRRRRWFSDEARGGGKVELRSIFWQCAGSRVSPCSSR